jgi:adenylate kinase family enzyme
MEFKRVHIFGGAGSGKTTLAREYSTKFGLPHHELDDFYYLEAAARKRRQKIERDRLLIDSVAAEEWILDGIFWQPWVQPSIERADKIIVLAIPEKTQHVRVVKRHFQLLSEANMRDYPNFFPTLFELLKHNRIYNSGPLQETLELLARFDEKLSVCTTNSEAAVKLGL